MIFYNKIKSQRMRQLGWCQPDENEQVIVKVPLLFTFPPVETLMKELTKLNSNHAYRIAYLGPRWADSVTFHKKYSNGNYVFNQRKISKNSSMVNSMLNNQFYKNEIFYRAFEGMNPTLNLQEQLIFQSRFEGGNLDCVVKVSNNEYDLFLRIDSNTRGNLFWFYFAVRRCLKGKRVKFNICNLTKSGTHYQKGLNPYIYSSITKTWSQEGMSNVTFKEKRLRYDFLYERLRIRSFYELSFEVEFKGEEEIRFAYCVPYTYSDLLKDLKQISSVAEVATLGQTFTGINIPVVMIGKHDNKVQKQVLFITGRVHPGESNSSLVLANFMKYLCFSPEAKYLRQKVITVIVPMINPDGVILGNSRCGASGKDLNRQFRATSKIMFPEVVLIKNLVDKIMQTHDLQVYLDFHGHSRKKNMFIFGPSYNVTQPEYYKCRVLPKILSNVTPIFRYFSCTYDIPNDKKNTARAVMLNQMLVPLVYTVQTSLGFYHDYNLHKDLPFTVKKWQEIGENFVIALKEYYEGVQQYDLFIEAKRSAKKMLVEQVKQSALSTNPSPVIFRKQSKDHKKEIKQIKDPKELKYFKIFEEIKKEEQKKAKQEKKQKQAGSQSESDSHNEEQQFEKQKMREFSGMITDCVEEEAIKQKNMNLLNELQHSSKKNQKVEPIKSRKMRQQEILKKRSMKMKEEEKILSQNAVEESKAKVKRKDVRTESKHRENSFKKNEIYVENIKGVKQFTEGLKKIYPSFRQEQLNHQQRQQVLAKHHYLDDDVDFLSVQKKSNNKMNIRMFNFSKMVQNNNPLRYNEPKHKEIRIIIPNQEQSMQEHKEFSRSLNIEYPVQKPRPLNLQNIAEEQEQMSFNKRNEQSRHQKTKTAFPPSFYRIKYHNSQRKRQEIKRERQLSDFEQYRKISYFHGQNMTNNFKEERQPQSYSSNQLEVEDEQYENRGKLMAYIKRFPFH